MDKFSNAIKCSSCLKVLSRPVMLPCGHSICKAHIEQSANDKVICNKCSKQHSNCGDFALNESLSEVIAQINSLDFGENHKEAKHSCENLSDVISQIDVFLKDPDFYIHEFIGEFRRRVDLKHEEYKLKLEQETQRILAELDKIEADCKEKLKTSKDFKELASAKEKAQQQLDEYLCALNELKVDIDKWKDVKMRCEKEVGCLKEKLSETKSCFFESELKISKVEFQVQIDINPLWELRESKVKIDIDSMILINDDQKMKFVNLCEFASNTKFELLYRGSRDGFAAQDFHAKCDNKSKTVTIVKSTSNNVFGGYTEASWMNTSYSFARDPNAFLISFINHHGQPIKIKIDPSRVMNSICNHSSFLGPTFGGGHDIFITSNCNLNTKSYSKLGNTYKHSIFENDSSKAKSFLAGSYNFQVAEIEVYQII